MQVLWSKSPQSSGEIFAALAALDSTWHPKTAQTMLNRLVTKKAVGFTKEGRAYLYHPLVTETECVTAASESFLDRVFGGSLAPMLAHFARHRKLSAADARELRRLLKEGATGSGKPKP